MADNSKIADQDFPVDVVEDLADKLRVGMIDACQKVIDDPRYASLSDQGRLHVMFNGALAGASDVMVSSVAPHSRDAVLTVMMRNLPAIFAASASRADPTTVN